MRVSHLSNGFNQLGSSDIQTVGKFHDVNQANVPVPALDAFHIVAV